MTDSGTLAMSRGQPVTPAPTGESVQPVTPPPTGESVPMSAKDRMLAEATA